MDCAIVWLVLIFNGGQSLKTKVNLPLLVSLRRIILREIVLVNSFMCLSHRSWPVKSLLCARYCFYGELIIRQLLWLHNAESSLQESHIFKNTVISTGKSRQLHLKEHINIQMIGTCGWFNSHRIAAANAQDSEILNCEGETHRKCPPLQHCNVKHLTLRCCHQRENEEMPSCRD